MLLDVQNVTKRFAGTDAEVTVLDNLSMALKAGETVALTGESGSGKSTLLHIIAGLEPCDSGTVVFEGTDIRKLDETGRANLRRSDVSVVFQQFNLIPSLTIGQNITFQAQLAGVDYGAPRLEGLIDSLGLQDQLEKYPEQLSGGQQQRVAIARALLHGPKLVLADEPTGNLDETTGCTVFDLLVGLARSHGSGLLIATHSERLARLADRRLHLSHGTLTG